MNPRAVLDTNVVVSAFVFEHGRLVWLRNAWTASHFKPLASRHTAEAVLRVLGYPKFRLDRSDIEVLLADYLPFVETVDIPSAGVAVPEAPDPADRILLEAAAAGKAQFLVTGDRRLRALSQLGDCRILTPAEFRAALGRAAGGE